MEELAKIETLCRHVKRASLCGLGQAAPNPILSTLQNFGDEYEAHILEKRCPAGVCQALLQYFIDPEKCVGCSLCAKICPVKCIAGEPKKLYNIDTDICIKCGECMKRCPVKAIYRK